MYKKRYRYPKDWNININEEISIQGVHPIFFIDEEIKAKKILIEEIQKNITKQLKTKSMNNTRLIDYFLDPATSQIEEVN